MSDPILSVVMPVFNALPFLPDAIESILGQTFTDFEFIIVDDGSSDGSFSAIREFEEKDRRIRVISRPNTGIVGALNDGLTQARGKYVARMDADDVAERSRLDAQISYLEKTGECVAVGGAVVYTDPALRPLKLFRPPTCHQEIKSELMLGNGGAIVHPSATFRRAAVETAGGYREKYNWIEDLDLYVRLVSLGRLANLSDVVLKYRQHRRSVFHSVGDQIHLRREIVSVLYGRRKSEVVLTEVEISTSVSDLYRKWAYWALEGQNYGVALRYAVMALLRRPWEKANLYCLFYAFRVLHRGGFGEAARR